MPQRTCLLALDEVQHALLLCVAQPARLVIQLWVAVPHVDGPLYELAPLSLFRRVREICDKRPKHGWEVDREAYVVSRVFPIVDAIRLYIFRYK